jgi:hypothetical protein
MARTLVFILITPIRATTPIMDLSGDLEATIHTTEGTFIMPIQWLTAPQEPITQEPVRCPLVIVRMLHEQHETTQESGEVRFEQMFAHRHGLSV